MIKGIKLLTAASLAVGVMAASMATPAYATHQIGHAVAGGIIGGIIGSAIANANRPYYQQPAPVYVAPPPRRNCWQVQRVWTDYGWREQQVWVC